MFSYQIFKLFKRNSNQKKIYSQSDFWNNDESQSSLQSSTSLTVEYERKKRSKMEVGDHDG